MEKRGLSESLLCVALFSGLCGNVVGDSLGRGLNDATGVGSSRIVQIADVARAQRNRNEPPETIIT